MLLLTWSNSGTDIVLALLITVIFQRVKVGYYSACAFATVFFC